MEESFSKIKTTIVILGTISSGKSTLAYFISEEYGLPVVSFGAYTKHYCEQHNLGTDRKDLQKVGEGLVSDNPALFVMNAINFGAKNEPVVILEGIRHKTILESIKNICEKTICIFIDADFEVRYQRYLDRQKDMDKVKTLEEFSERDNHSMENEAKNLKDSCALVIDSTQDYKMIVKSLLDKEL